MTPYGIKYVQEEDLVIFKKIRNAVLKLPDINLGVDEEGDKILLFCHILARAVARVFLLKYVDGFFIPNFCHSWILSPNNHVIDVYPVGILGGPILMVASGSAPLIEFHYKEANLKNEFPGLFSSPSFQGSIRIVEACLRMVI